MNGSDNEGGCASTRTVTNMLSRGAASCRRVARLRAYLAYVEHVGVSRQMVWYKHRIDGSAASSVTSSMSRGGVKNEHRNAA